MAMSLDELDFRDLYIADKPGFPASFNLTRSAENAGKRPNMLVPDVFREAIDELRDTIYQHPKSKFALQMDGFRLRVQKSVTFNKTRVACCRVIPDTLPDLDDLNYHPSIMEEMMGWGRRAGLVAVCGATGSGKSTGVAGYLKKLLDRDGGVLVAIEDPVEFVFQGQGGSLWQALQWEVDDNAEWAPRIADAMRCAPSIIYVGEVRTPDAAEWLLSAANSGHFVIFTTHGRSIIEGLSRLLQIARINMGSNANAMLADSLIGAWHQKIVKGAPDVSLITTAEELGSADPIRPNIRQDKLEMLGNEITAQTNRRRAQWVSKTSSRATETDARRRA